MTQLQTSKKSDIVLKSKIFFLLIACQLFAISITPLQKYSSSSIYEEYVSYLVNNKKISLVDINKSLNSKNFTLNYYEAMLKISYEFYYMKNADISYYLDIISKQNTKNSFEGLIIDDIKLSLGQKSENVEFYFCNVLFDDEFKMLCKANYLAHHCDEDIRLNEFSLTNLEEAEYVNKLCGDKK